MEGGGYYKGAGENLGGQVTEWFCVLIMMAIAWLCLCQNSEQYTKKGKLYVQLYLNKLNQNILFLQISKKQLDHKVF